MAIIDLDSHLRNGWFLDEIYKLDGPFAAEKSSSGIGHRCRYIRGSGSTIK